MRSTTACLTHQWMCDKGNNIQPNPNPNPHLFPPPRRRRGVVVYPHSTTGPVAKIPKNKAWRFSSRANFHWPQCVLHRTTRQLHVRVQARSGRCFEEERAQPHWVWRHRRQRRQQRLTLRLGEFGRYPTPLHQEMTRLTRQQRRHHHHNNNSKQANPNRELCEYASTPFSCPWVPQGTLPGRACKQQSRRDLCK